MKNTAQMKAVQFKLEILEDRRLLSASINGDYFPYLNNYKILAPASEIYNCISYTLGDYNTWISSATPLIWINKLYLAHGFKRLPTMNVSLVKGEKKVVLYSFNNKTEIQHAELQDKDGTWSSKLGDGPLIRYNRYNALAGVDYGHPIAVYEKGV